MRFDPHNVNKPSKRIINNVIIVNTSVSFFKLLNHPGNAEKLKNGLVDHPKLLSLLNQTESSDVPKEDISVYQMLQVFVYVEILS